jgi:hypothetical protein
MRRRVDQTLCIRSHVRRGKYDITQLIDGDVDDDAQHGEIGSALHLDLGQKLEIAARRRGRRRARVDPVAASSGVAERMSACKAATVNA